MEAELKRCLLDINHSNRESLVRHLPLVLDKLIELLVTAVTSVDMSSTNWCENLSFRGPRNVLE